MALVAVVVVAAVIGLSLAAVAVRGDVVTDEGTATRAYRSAYECPIASAGERADASTPCAADECAFTGADAAMLVARVIVEVTLGEGGYSGQCGEGGEGRSKQCFFSSLRSPAPG